MGKRKLKSISEIDEASKNIQIRMNIYDVVDIMKKNDEIDVQRELDRALRSKANRTIAKVTDKKGCTVLHSDGYGNLFRTDFEHMREEDIPKVLKKAEEYIRKGTKYLERGRKYQYNAFMKRNQVKMDLEQKKKV